MAETRLDAVMRENQAEVERRAQQRLAAAAGMDTSASIAPAPAKPIELSEDIQAGMAAGNINITATGERMELSAEVKAEMKKHEELLGEFARRKQVRTTTVPTADIDVKARLRELEEPICLFGENPGDRRDRLRNLLIARGEAQPKRPEEIASDDEEEVAKPPPKRAVWYHPGPAELTAAREFIAKYSFPRARDRLKAARIALARPDQKKGASRQQLFAKIQSVTSVGSQIGDSRPLTYCEFSPDGSMLATGSMNGLAKLWKVPTCDPVRSLRGHTERIGSIAWHPEATKSLADSVMNLISCSSDGQLMYWSLDSDVPIHRINLEGGRISRARFHPSGRFIAAACFDHSWRMLDLETGQEILHQEGHSRACYELAYHPDGSLVVTGGQDALARVWDLRSGKNISVLQGHVKPVLGVDFAPNGYHLITGSNDHTVRLWDIREQKSAYTLPAHTNLLSNVKYQNNGDFFVTGSYDNSAKIWTSPDCLPLKTLATQTKVMYADISPVGDMIATASYDNTFKLWAAE